MMSSVIVSSSRVIPSLSSVILSLSKDAQS
jgi:hypothetical protein